MCLETQRGCSIPSSRTAPVQLGTQAEYRRMSSTTINGFTALSSGSSQDVLTGHTILLCSTLQLCSTTLLYAICEGTCARTTFAAIACVPRLVRPSITATLGPSLPPEAQASLRHDRSRGINAFHPSTRRSAAPVAPLLPAAHCHQFTRTGSPITMLPISSLMLALGVIIARVSADHSITTINRCGYGTPMMYGPTWEGEFANVSILINM
jgi:hypothetical protein